MFAIIETGGKQYTVAPNQVIKIEKLGGETGAQVIFDKVLLYANDTMVKLGKPYVEGVKVVGSIIDHVKGKKIYVLKYKAKSRYRRLMGHRQLLTEVKISDIAV